MFWRSSRFDEVLSEDIGVGQAEGPEVQERGFVGGDGRGGGGADELPAGGEGQGAARAITTDF